MAIGTLKNTCCILFFATLVGILLVLANAGMFQRVYIYESQNPKCIFFYKNYHKAYLDLTNDIQADIDFIKENKELSKMYGQSVGYMGMYYDSPSLEEQNALSTATVGFYSTDNISQATMHEISDKGYQYAMLSKSHVVQAYIQWRFPYSIWIAILKLYSPILHTIIENYPSKVSSNVPYVEYTSMGNYIVSYPIGKERMQYKLTNYTEPATN